MVDAGCKWDAQTALERAKMLADFNVAWLEEPLDQDDLAGYDWLCARSPVPIARSLIRDPPPLGDGCVAVPKGPGLGIELDEQIIEEYRVSS